MAAYFFAVQECEFIVQRSALWLWNRQFLSALHFSKKLIPSFNRMIDNKNDIDAITWYNTINQKQVETGRLLCTFLNVQH